MWRFLPRFLTALLCFITLGLLALPLARNPLAPRNLKRNMFIQGFFLLMFIATGYFITYILLRG
jgi:hypothetical protein